MWKLTLFCSMFRLMEAAESLSITDWKLLTDVLLLGLAESGHKRQFYSQKPNQSSLNLF